MMEAVQGGNVTCQRLRTEVSKLAASNEELVDMNQELTIKNGDQHQQLVQQAQVLSDWYGVF